MNNFQKTAIITGGAKRIGEKIVKFLASIGWNVIIHHDKSQKEASNLVQFIVENFKVKACAIKADLRDKNASSDIFKQAEAFGEISLIVNNAAMFANDNMKKIKIENLQDHFMINCFSPIILAKLFASQLKGDGNIINISDYAISNYPDKKFFSYILSKMALAQATQLLALELAPSIRVNAIAPGPILGNERQSVEQFSISWQENPLNKSGTSIELSRTIEYILSTPSLTGQTIYLSGGKQIPSHNYI